MARENNFVIERKNAPRSWLVDNYYKLIRLSWSRLIVFTFLFYLGVNLIFGFLYFLLREGLNPPNLGFWQCYFFSVHTFSTVGYGNISPGTIGVDFVTVLEIFFGLLFMALLTGLFFSKFSQPTARFIFTDKILLTRHRGRKALLFRVANVRNNRVMDAQITMNALYNETTEEGITFRRIEDLPLDRSHTPTFVLSFTGAHFVEKGSFTESLLARARAGENVEFLISIRGLDDTFGQTIHASRVYGAEDLVEGGQFEDILSIKENRVRSVDFANFNRLKS